MENVIERKQFIKQRRQQTTKKANKKLITILIGVAIALGVMAFLTQPTHAATGMATIDVSTLDISVKDNSTATTESQWTYSGAGSRKLTLSETNGNYTLKGSNTNLNVIVSGAKVNITFNGVNIKDPSSNGWTVFDVKDGCSITLIGSNSITKNGNGVALVLSSTAASNNHTITSSTSGSLTLTTSSTTTISRQSGVLSITGNATVSAINSNDTKAALYLLTSEDCSVGSNAKLTVSGGYGISVGGKTDPTTIKCDGTLEVTGNGGSGITAEYSPAIILSGTGTTKVTGTTYGIAKMGQPLEIKDCQVTVVGGGTRAFSLNTIKMNDAAKLTITNNAAANNSEIFNFSNTSGGSTRLWKLTGLTTTNLLNSNTITTTLSPGPTGTVERSAPIAPTITSANTFSCPSGKTSYLPLTAAGLSTTPLKFTLSGAPTGVTITGDNILTVAPGAAVGTHSFTLTANNGVSPNATQNFTLFVTGVAPTITSNNNYTCTQGEAGSFNLTADGSAPVTWTLSGTVPAGVSVAGSTLKVLNSVASGTHTFTVKADNTYSPAATQTFTLNVVSVVCKIGATNYTTLDAALTAVPTGGTTPTTITLLQNITYTKPCTIPNKEIIFDLNGKNLNFDCAAGMGDTALTVTNNSKVDYTGSGEFNVKAIPVTSGEGGECVALLVDSNSSCTVTNVESQSDYEGGAVVCRNKSSATVANEVVSSVMPSGEGKDNGFVAVYVDNSDFWTSCIIAERNGIQAANAATVEVENVTSDKRAVICDSMSFVHVTDDVSGKYDGGIAAFYGRVFVGGNVTSTYSFGVSAANSSEVKVDGFIHANPYIMLGTAATVKTKEQYSQIAGGNLIYADSTNSVLVRHKMISGITVTGTASITKAGGITQLTPIIAPSFADIQDLTWTSSNSSVAAVDDEGVVIAKDNGTTTIRAAAKDGSGKYGELLITVSGQPILVTNVNVAGTDTITANGGTTQLTAQVLPSNATDKAVIWTSSNPSIATVDSDGLVTAIRNGTTTIRATAIDGSDKYGELTITVSGQVVKIDTTRKTVWIQTGKSLSIPAVVYNENEELKADLTWKSSNTKIATVTQKGLVKIPKKVKKGKATITATAANGTVLKVTVNVSPKAIKLKKASVTAPKTLTVGQSKKLTIKLSPAKATGINVTFKSSKPSGLYVDKAGKLTAKAKGKYTITIKAGTKIVKKTITVK